MAGNRHFKNVSVTKWCDGSFPREVKLLKAVVVLLVILREVALLFPVCWLQVQMQNLCLFSQLITVFMYTFFVCLKNIFVWRYLSSLCISPSLPTLFKSFTLHSQHPHERRRLLHCWLLLIKNEQSPCLKKKLSNQSYHSGLLFTVLRFRFLSCYSLEYSPQSLQSLIRTMGGRGPLRGGASLSGLLVRECDQKGTVGCRSLPLFRTSWP